MEINQNPTDNTDVELEYTDNTYYADMYLALERLHENEDFKKVILEGYFKDKAVKGVSLLATDHVRANNARGAIMEELVAISALEDYFKTIINMGAAYFQDSEESDEV